jgi:hypothetical protein
MTNLHEWEVIHSVKVQDYGTCAMTRRLAVPGGWMYEVRAQWDERKPTLMMVPDPTAPHCQPTPPADDRPPMTDEALRAWLTATYGEPRENSAGSLAWGYSIPGRGQVDNVWRVNASRWYIPGNALEYCLPASIAGPALWAAHRYGTP